MAQRRNGKLSAFFAALRLCVRLFFDLLNRIVFAALGALIVIAAIPYGTVEPWWKAAFVCAVFAICIVALIESRVSGSFRIEGGQILLPMLALSALAFIQTLSLGSLEVAGFSVWNTISADPYQTRFFALQMLALTACLALFYRYVRGRVIDWRGKAAGGIFLLVFKRRLASDLRPPLT